MLIKLRQRWLIGLMLIATAWLGVACGETPAAISTATTDLRPTILTTGFTPTEKPPSANASVSFSNMTIGPVVTPTNSNSNAGVPSNTPVAVQSTPTISPTITVAIGTIQVTTPAAATSAANKKATDFPCVAIEQFALANGAYNQLIGKKACMEATIASAGARVPGGDVYIRFKGYANLEGLIQSELRGRFDKTTLDTLKDKKVRIYGTIVKSDILKQPILQIDWPEQIEVLP